MGLGGKSDIMPCNLFLRFSEPRHEERSTKHPVMQRCRSGGKGAAGQGEEGGGKEGASKVKSTPSTTHIDFARGSWDIRAATATQAHAHIEERKRWLRGCGVNARRRKAASRVANFSRRDSPASQPLPTAPSPGGVATQGAEMTAETHWKDSQTGSS